MTSAQARQAVGTSVVVSTLDRPLLLSRCLDALLAGTRPPDEIVVVDQGDPRVVSEVLAARRGRGPDLVHVVQEGRGLSRSQNAGVARARCPVVCVVDDDCVPDAGWVAVAGREHATATGALLLTGRVLPLPPNGERVLPLSSRTSQVRRVLPPDTPPWEVGTGGNFSVTREAYLAAGGNDERLGTGTAGRAGNDLDLFHRLQRAGVEVRYEPDLLVLHERASAAEHRSRRWTYGFGAGACVALWRAEQDPDARRILRAWLALRVGIVRGARRPRAAANEARVLLGTAQGLWFGWRVARSDAARSSLAG